MQRRLAFDCCVLEKWCGSSLNSHWLQLRGAPPGVGIDASRTAAAISQDVAPARLPFPADMRDTDRQTASIEGSYHGTSTRLGEITLSDTLSAA